MLILLRVAYEKGANARKAFISLSILAALRQELVEIAAEIITQSHAPGTNTTYKTDQGHYFEFPRSSGLISFPCVTEGNHAVYCLFTFAADQILDELRLLAACIRSTDVSRLRLGGHCV